MKGKSTKSSKTTKPATKKAPAKTVKKETVKEAAVVKTEVVKEEKIMKGKVEKKTNNVIKFVKLGTLAAGLVLIILSLFLVDYNVPLAFFGVILTSLAGIIHSVNAEKHSLIKSIGVLFLAGVVLTWLLPNGYFTGAEFTDYGLKRTGLSDLSTIAYYSSYFSLDKIVFLVVFGIFYTFISKLDAYQSIISGIALKLKGKEKIVTIASIVLFVLLTSMISQSLIVLLFVPFVISILNKLKFDKVSAFAITFGAILIGTIGAPWGTEGLSWFSEHTQLPVSTGIEFRLVIQLAATVLFTLFALLKLSNNKGNENLVEDPFVVEAKESSKKVMKLPLIIILSLTTVLLLLGYINWTANFEILVFSDFHTWLLGLTIGEDFAIFANILGSAAMPFGNWDLLVAVIILVIVMLILALAYRVSFDTILDNLKEGFKRISTPILLLILVFGVFVAAYVSPFVGTFTNWLFSFTTGFEPNLTAISAFFASVFHPDLGYTGFIVGPYITAAMVDYTSIVYTIYTSMYGLVQVFVPSSLILILGLYYTKVSYKAWLKYIWMFLIGMLIVLLVLFNVVGYL